MIEPTRIYLFRSSAFAPHGDAVVCAAPAEQVAAAFGRGGHEDQDGLRRAFDGCALYRDDATGARFLGVWGRRNAARFRAVLRERADLVIVREPPPARLTWWVTEVARPRRHRHTAGADGRGE